MLPTFNFVTALALTWSLVCSRYCVERDSLVKRFKTIERLERKDSNQKSPFPHYIISQLLELYFYD
jgi:hypothetical protein